MEEDLDTIWLPLKVIGQKISTIRQRKGLSQDDLAKLLGMQTGQAAVSRWERGIQLAPYEKLLRIAKLGGQGIEIFQIQDDERELGPPSVHEVSAPYATSREDITIADLEGMVRNVGGKGDLTPEEQRARRIDILEGLIQGRKERNAPVPDGFYALLGKVQSDDF